MKRLNRFLRLAAGLAVLTATSVALAPSAGAHPRDIHDPRGSIVDLVRAALRPRRSSAPISRVGPATRPSSPT